MTTKTKRLPDSVATDGQTTGPESALTYFQAGILVAALLHESEPKALDGAFHRALRALTDAPRREASDALRCIYTYLDGLEA